MSVTTSSTPSAAHARQNDSALASLEKRLLVWIAERLPALIGSDHLTLLGLVSMLAVGAAFAASARDPRVLYLVPALLALNWFGDSLDGTVARVRNQQRPRYGYYVDHVVDVVGSVALFSGLALSGGMQPFIAMALLVAYVAAMAEVFLATHVTHVFRLASFGFGPTELRIVLAVGARRARRAAHGAGARRRWRGAVRSGRRHRDGRHHARVCRLGGADVAGARPRGTDCAVTTRRCLALRGDRRRGLRRPDDGRRGVCSRPA